MKGESMESTYTGFDNSSNDKELNSAVTEDIKETKLCLEESKLKSLKQRISKLWSK